MNVELNGIDQPRPRSADVRAALEAALAAGRDADAEQAAADLDELLAVLFETRAAL